MLFKEDGSCRECGETKALKRINDPYLPYHFECRYCDEYAMTDEQKRIKKSLDRQAKKYTEEREKRIKEIEERQKVLLERMYAGEICCICFKEHDEIYVGACEWCEMDAEALSETKHV